MNVSTTLPRLAVVPDTGADAAGVTLFLLAVPNTVSAEWLRRRLGEIELEPVLATAPRPTLAAVPAPRDILEVGELVMELDRFRVTVAGQVIDFTHQEFLLLRAFLQNPGRVYSRRQLLDLAWDLPAQPHGSTGRTVDVHVRRVRVKLGPEAHRLVTVRGFGYRFETS